ncbi:MAG: glutamate-5-semialdehyde dehydrogenase [Oscillospiraceae bacterium]|nr:glutamate-5-semialdehyde dehydrogenase [Oscillospiraceae bacterium]
MTVREQAAAAAKAALCMMSIGTREKDRALLAMADALERGCEKILAENAKDLKLAEEAGRPAAMLDRLRLTPERISGMAGGLRKVAALEDPVGGEDFSLRRPNGLSIGCRRVPLGVVGIIYEARPNVTADAIGLCIKSGNACVLRGGKEAINSNIAIAETMRAAVKSVGLPEDCITLVEDTSRESANEMMKANGLIDVLIPRGGAGLIRSVVQNATVPVIETGTGNCHIYVDADADIEMAVKIAVNAKCSRPSVCNAAESFLIHRDAAESFLKAVKAPLDEYNVEIRGCKKTAEILGSDVVPATEEDYATEFLDYKVSVLVVDSVEEAMEHIAKYGTKHSECIVTESYKNAKLFTERVDAAAVYVNASTRFTDGGEFGLGAEIGISTQKLHARGPMGLEHLTTVKYIVMGEGQIR